MENKFIALIEIPKGDDRRRHFNKEENKVIDMGSLAVTFSKEKVVAPANYGFIKNTKCLADNEEIDVWVLSKNKLEIGKELEVFPISLIIRVDGDDKIIAVDETLKNVYKTWTDLPREEQSQLEKFISFIHKIIAIKGPKEAEEYLIKNGK